MGNFPKLPEGTQLPVGSHQVTIKEYLSEGGFAHIYKVKIEPQEDESEIACLKRVIVPDKNGLNQLRKEVDVMKTLRHGRNIVKYYDSHADRLENGTYQVLVLMELCPNKSLLDYMNAKIKTKLAEPEIFKILLDISLGIYEMHRLKLIHRDIKIENVLIDAKHNFKLCDFGSSCPPIMPPKGQQQFQALSHDILYQTTPQYRAPEMIDLYRGFPIDEKADIWALGCFLYKLCYYTTPFEANGDIAILHASFQFLPTPSFSGDLKNLIIIMLQENPLFRPNIVQVIMLVSKMMNIEFKDIEADDFYNAGPYNFNALHEFQRHKQNELLKQQQLYYQQQALATVSKFPSSASVANPNPQLDKQSMLPSSISPQPSQAYSEAAVHPPQKMSLITSQKSVNIINPQKDYKQYTKDDQKSNESGYDVDNEEEEEEKYDDDSLGELDGLDNVEERYPSLDDLLEYSGKKSHSGPEKRDLVDITLPNSNNNTSYPLFPQNYPQYPDQPIVLSDSEIQKLSPEKLQQYNYSHQLYHYKLNKYQYNVQQESMYNNNNDIQQHPRPVSSKEPIDLEKKEAWERSHSKIDKDAEKLVDDIFSTGDKSPNLPTTQPQRTSQSIKSDVSSSKKSVSGEELSLTKSNELPNQEGEDLSLHLEDHTKDPDSNDLTDFGIENKAESVTALDAFPTNDAEFFDANDALNVEIDTSPENFQNQVPSIHIPQQSQYSSQSIVPTLHSTTLGGSGNQFPFKQPQRLQQQHFEDVKKQSEIMTAPPRDARKNANPWGDFRKPASSTTPMMRVSSLPVKYGPIESSKFALQDQFVSLAINDSHKKTTSTSASRQGPVESNLIDLEVGLDSSSSSVATPVLKSNSNNKELYSMDSEASLIDLDIEEEKAVKSGEARPHFKKRISSKQNPSSFNFQEEVIDFASDDENPDNSSQMNRLSIRNTLKKPKSRKSSDHKRPDSSSNEGKKRLSFFGSNTTNN